MKSALTVNVQFEEKYFFKCLRWLDIPVITLKVSIKSHLILFSSKVVNPFSSYHFVTFVGYFLANCPRIYCYTHNVSTDLPFVPFLVELRAFLVAFGSLHIKFRTVHKSSNHTVYLIRGGVKVNESRTSFR